MENIMRELTPAELETPYAGYCSRPVTKPAASAIDPIMAGQMNPADAMLPEEINRMLVPDYHHGKNGYRVLENGAGHVSTSVDFPGCNMEMLYWWFAWHPLEPVRYTLWHPQAHHSVAISDIHRKKILDPSIPLEEKTRGVIHLAVEDIGTGLGDMLIHFQSPAQMGFDMSKFYAPNVAGAIGAWCETYDRQTGEKGFVLMLHTFKEIEGGICLFSKFWMGYKLLGGHPALMLPPGVSIPEIVPKGLALHSVEEYTNLSAILPELYEAYGPEVK